MDNESLTIPITSAKGLLDVSSKKSLNYLSQDMDFDQISFPHSPTATRLGLGNDISMSPGRSEGMSMELRLSKYNSKPEMKKIEEKIFIPEVLEDFDNEEIDSSEPAVKRIQVQKRLEKLKIENNLNTSLNSSCVVKETNSAKLPSRIFSGIFRSKMDRTSSLKSATSKKTRTGTLNTERRDSDPPPTSLLMPKMGSSTGKMNFFGLIEMARKMGLVRGKNAYEDYMSKDQFNMIKDLSTGRFDPKEEKRTEQMTRLKVKLMMNSGEMLRSKVHRKRTNIIDWQNNLVPSLKRMYDNFRHSIKKVITPNGSFRVVWDMMIMLLIFYDLILVPLELSFDVPLPQALKYWDIAETLFYFIDIILNFNTGFYHKGMLVMSRPRIAGHYLKGWFWVDTIASFPYEYALDSEYFNEEVPGNNDTYQVLRLLKFLKFIRIFRFLRIFKLKKIFVKLEGYIDMSTTLMSIVGFLKLSLIILFIAHWFACLWHFVSILELETYPETWITRNGIVDADWVERYVTSIYWATTTMITVGYGDIVPVTTNEQLVTVLAMLVASAVFAYTMNRINLILTGLENSSESYQKALATITDYMRKKHVKKELQIKIKKYLEYALEVETSLDSNEVFLNTYLNQSLKNELITEIHGKILLDNPMFMRFDSNLIMRTSLIMKEKIFSPEDPVFLETDNDDLSLYIIHSGRVEIFNFRSNSYLKTLIKGNFFGEISFFTGQPRSASARSTDFSALYLVKRSEFIELMDEFPLEREKFFEVKDNLLIYQEQKVINLRCYSCGFMDHTVNECPKVHVVVSKSKYIEKYIEKRTKFMADYIRTGMRGDKRPSRYTAMMEAAKKIQLKVWEGEIQINKTLLHMASTTAEMPEFVEHPAMLFVDKRKSRYQTIEIDSSRKNKSLSADRDKNGATLPSIDLETGSATLKEKGNNSELKAKRNSTQLGSKISVKKEKKQNKIFDDIDRIRSFAHYFPHNNFEKLHPQNVDRRKTGLFDYFEQSDTAKATLKKFANILKERVRAKKEALAAANKEKENKEKDNKDDGKRKSIFSKIMKGNGSPLRSRFYKESRASFLGDNGSPKGSKKDKADFGESSTIKLKDSRKNSLSSVQSD